MILAVVADVPQIMHITELVSLVDEMNKLLSNGTPADVRTPWRFVLLCFGVQVVMLSRVFLAH